MTSKWLVIWFSTFCIILVLWGITFAFFGLGLLPIINQNILLPWESALYGAVLMGWGLMLFLVARIAFRRKDKELLQSMLLGLLVWLIVEALFSAYFGVWFNVGVDAAVSLLLGIPLVKGIREINSTSLANKKDE